MQAQYRGGYPTAYEPDCCGCFPLGCGVRTLFFLVFLFTLGVIINVIIGAVNEEWFSMIQLLLLPGAFFTIFYILMWMQQDNFYNRNKISQGFRCMFIVNILVNLVILVLVVFAIEEFVDFEKIE